MSAHVKDSHRTSDWLGFGTAGVGNLYRAVSDDEAAKSLSQVIKARPALLDTAPHYGAGLAEQRVGQALNSHPSTDIPISTKVGRRIRKLDVHREEVHGFVGAGDQESFFDYSSRGIRTSLEQSLKRIGISSVDILLLHDIGAMTHGKKHSTVFDQALKESFPEMRRVQNEGLTQKIGIGVNEVEVCFEVLNHIDIDVIMLAGRFTLFEQTESIPLLDLCRDKGIDVLVAGPFNSGLLVATEPTELRYNYDQPTDTTLKRREELKRVCESHGVPLPAAALQAAKRHPAVRAVVPGFHNADQITEIVEWAEWNIPQTLWTDLISENLLDGRLA